MEAEGWGFLEPGLAENVIHSLKTEGLWRRDGAALRLVCRHWCLEVDRHVVSINPHRHRNIAARDLSSLGKFSRLVALHATPFVRAYESECGPSIPLLSRLPLARLKLSNDSWNGIGVTALAALTGLTALALHTRYATHVPESHLRLLSRLPLQELSLRCPLNRMEPFFRRCRSVTQLEALVLPGDRALTDRLDWLLGVAALKLDFCPIIHDFELPNLQNLAVVTTLTALDVSSFVSSDLDYLDGLPSLIRLDASVATTEILSTASFRRVLHRLRHLQLRAVSPLDLGGMTRSGTRLSSLHLDGFSVDASSLQTRRLERLAIHSCRLFNTQSFFSDLPPLKALSSSCLRDPFSQLHLSDADLSGMKQLKLRLQDVDGITVVARLTRLEVLGLQTRDPLSLQALRRLGSLNRLIHFGVSPAFPESAVRLFLGLKLINRLEVLYLGDAEGFNASSLKMLKDVEPHLIIETEATEFESFMRTL